MLGLGALGHDREVAPSHPSPCACRTACIYRLMVREHARVHVQAQGAFRHARARGARSRPGGRSLAPVALRVPNCLHLSPHGSITVSYTHLTLPTNREV